MLTDDELTELDTILLSLPVDDDGMLLSEFDGFCAGLITCPEMILPSEWLPCIWGEGAEPFESEQRAEVAMDLIMRHYSSVAAALTPPMAAYEPLYDVDTRTDEVLWQSWVNGFERAMRLRPDAWEHIVERDDEEAAASVNMMLALYDITEGQSDLPKSSIKALESEAPDLIPNLVLTINGWTKGLSQSDAFPMPFAANQTDKPFRREKVGRNEPCPCGSGRKYKRCCGSN